MIASFRAFGKLKALASRVLSGRRVKSLHANAPRTWRRNRAAAKSIVRLLFALPELALGVVLLIALAAPVVAQPVVITSAPPPNGTVGVAYSYTVRATGFLVGFGVTPNSLPPGLSLSQSTGVISGTPSTAGTYFGAIVASSPFYPTQPATQLFTIVIAQAGRGQVITFAPLVDRPLSNLGYGLIATATSGLAVSFASLTPATCFTSGNFVYLLGVGTCSIRASQAGDVAHDPAPNVDRSFTITPALLSQTITFGALADRPLSAGAFSVSATASSGLPVSFSSLTTSICTVTATTVTPIALGTCTIRASQGGNATYAAAPNLDRSLNITLVSQTITFGSLSNHILGDAAFTVTATASSGLVVSFSSLTITKCTVSGTTVTLVAAGTCTIRASQAGNATYASAPNVDQAFSINQASQTITFGTLGNRTLGTAPFTVSATASSGLVVSFASLTTSVCTVSGNTVTLVSVGACTIRASQSGTATYAPAPNVDQSFMVTAPVTQYIYDGAGNLIRIQRTP